jgi:hypothetical protein
MGSSSIVEFLQGRVRLVGESFHRCETDLPKWFVCGITAMSLPSDEFLRAAKYKPGLMPNGWRSDRPDFFQKPVGCWATLLVRKCGKFWTIERERRSGETLFADGILCARTSEAAMRLAEFCDLLPDGLCARVR